jgi:hypothetical protein
MHAWPIQTPKGTDMSNCTTTLDHIVTLSIAEVDLLSKGDSLTDEERAQFADIRAALLKLWPIRRAELVFEQHGPPRMVSAPDPRSQKQVRRFAVGIQPLPSGGD